MSFSLLPLLDLSLRGSVVFLVVLIADQLLAGKMSARWRRAWWLLVPLAFLLPISLTPVFSMQSVSDIFHSPTPQAVLPAPPDHNLNPMLRVPAGIFISPAYFWLGLVWQAGMIVSALTIIVQTWKVQQQWSRKRFSTDPALLNLLEDAKVAAGVNAPIGLIVSDAIAAPALLGWLRPRILLPTFLATPDSADELRAVLLHELAHFKSLDIPINWLFATARVIHWFNPLAWLASAAWTRFIEEASDEKAILWMHEPDGTAYGEILLKTLGKCPGGPAPYGALAIGESIENLKRRILMIRNYRSKSNRGWLASAIVLTLGAVMTLSPILAVDEDQDAAKKAAVTDMQTWLGEMDAGDYAKSWSDAAKSFQKAVTSDKWVDVSKQVRTPLGKVVSRKFATAVYQVYDGTANPLKGTFVIAQFDTSFDNMKSARETVSFQKEDDGTWHAAGYFIKPE